MQKHILFDGSSDYGAYKIIDMTYNGRPARVLFADKQTPQSGIALDGNPEPLFSYNQRFLEIAQSIQPISILLIGGGAYTLPTALFEQFPHTTIDVVEIDPLLPQLATQYFNLPNDPRLHSIIADGRHYIDQSTAVYDLIIIDAFSGYDIPQPLITKEAVRQYSKHLTDKGVVALNFISRYHTYRETLTHTLEATFRPFFSYVELYPADYTHPKRDDQNIILVASASRLSLNYLQAPQIELLFHIENKSYNPASPLKH